jgi:hypothetical protein
VVGHALVAAAEDQRLEELVEHDPVADPGAMAAERMLINPLRQQGMELVPDGVGDPRWQHRHGGVRVGASATWILSAVPALLPPAYCRKLSADDLLGHLDAGR